MHFYIIYVYNQLYVTFKGLFLTLMALSYII